MDHTFKVGDIVKVKAGEDILAGAIAPFTVVEVGRRFIYVRDAVGYQPFGGYFPHRFEPCAAPKDTFKIGDRVEITASARSGGNHIAVGERGTIVSEPDSAFPYITLDGRFGRFVMGREKLLRIPGPITAKAAPKADFKYGDEVRVVRVANDSHKVLGRTGIVQASPLGGRVHVLFDGFTRGWGRNKNEFYVNEEALDLVTTVVPQRDIPKGSPFLADRPTSVGKHWFICVIDKDDEKPRPASVPRLYKSAEQARAVAHSMAEKNRTETFVVYEATDVIVAPPVSLPETQHHKL